MPKYIDFPKQPQEVQLAAHAIGLDRKRPYMRHSKAFYKPYRNYFGTKPGLPDATYWEDMHTAGYANKYHWPERVVYCLTKSGYEWLGNQLGVTIHITEVDE